MNPFLKIPLKLESLYDDWKILYPKKYDKFTTETETKLNLLMVTKTSKLAFDYVRNFISKLQNYKLKKVISEILVIENERLLKLKLLRPSEESPLETALYLEDLQVILQTELAIRETDKRLKDTFDFILLDDCDNLYVTANLYDITKGVSPADLISRNAEISPSRPTYLQHRHPEDYISRFHPKHLTKESILNCLIMIAVKRGVIDCYTESLPSLPNDLSRKFLQEITLIKVGHLCLYESFLPLDGSVLKNLIYLEYLNAYMFWSCGRFEKSEYLRKLFENFFDESVSILRVFTKLLKQKRNLNWFDVINDGEFPPPLRLKENISHIRKLKAEKTDINLLNGEFISSKNLPYNANFYKFQNLRNRNFEDCPSQKVIKSHRLTYGSDYRYEVAPNPIELHTK